LDEFHRLYEIKDIENQIRDHNYILHEDHINLPSKKYQMNNLIPKLYKSDNNGDIESISSILYEVEYFFDSLYQSISYNP
jgi:hypothetical protein